MQNSPSWDIGAQVWWGWESHRMVLSVGNPIPEEWGGLPHRSAIWCGLKGWLEWEGCRKEKEDVEKKHSFLHNLESAFNNISFDPSNNLR